MPRADESRGSASLPIDYARRPSRAPRGRWTRGFVILAAVVASASLLVYLLLPNLNRGPMPADRLTCASRLRQLGQAILIYANENGGRFPPSVERIYLDTDITSREFVCPTSGHMPAEGSTRAEVAANLTAGPHLSYVYVGAGMTLEVHPDTVMMYEDLAHHGGSGSNVLLGDGRVEWAPARDLREITKRLQGGKGPVLYTWPTGITPATRPTTRPAPPAPVTTAPLR